MQKYNSLIRIHYSIFGLQSIFTMDKKNNDRKDITKGY